MSTEVSRPEVWVRASGCQPSKVELNEPVRIDAASEDMIRAAFRHVKAGEESKA